MLIRLDTDYINVKESIEESPTRREKHNAAIGVLVGTQLEIKDFVSFVGDWLKFGKLVFAKALENDFESYRVEVLGDGAEWNGNVAKMYFPNALQVVDCLFLEEAVNAFCKKHGKANDWNVKMLPAIANGRCKSVIKTLVKLEIMRSKALGAKARIPRSAMDIYEDSNVPFLDIDTSGIDFKKIKEEESGRDGIIGDERGKRVVASLLKFLNLNIDHVEYVKYEKEGYVLGNKPVEIESKAAMSEWLDIPQKDMTLREARSIAVQNSRFAPDQWRKVEGALHEKLDPGFRFEDFDDSYED
jgi:hypothetical protein